MTVVTSGPENGRGPAVRRRGGSGLTVPDPARPAPPPGPGSSRHRPGAAQAGGGDRAGQAGVLARQVLAALEDTGYPGLQLIPLTNFSPLRVHRAQHVAAAWPVATSPGPGGAAPVTVWLLAGAGFAVSTPHGITEVPEPGALPGLPAVLDGLRAMSRRLAGP